MAMGRAAIGQDDLMATWAEMPRSPGHAFYDRLAGSTDREGGFDAFVEEAAAVLRAAVGAPSLPPGRYFRMHMVGYFEGIDSERGLAWRCADSCRCAISCGWRTARRFPIIRGCRDALRLPHEVHERVFGWVLKLVAEHGLVRGERIGVDGSTMEANAALRTIVRRDSGESYRADADADGARERHRDADGRGSGPLRSQPQGQEAVERRLESPTDPDARIAKMKDGTDASGLQARARGRSRHRRRRRGADPPGRPGDTTTLAPTLDAAARTSARSDRADKGSALRPGRRQGLSFARPTEGS